MTLLLVIARILDLAILIGTTPSFHPPNTCHPRSVRAVLTHEQPPSHHIAMDSCTSSQLDSVVLTVAAAVACTCLVQYLATKATGSDLSSEAVCWIILPLVFKLKAKPWIYVPPLGDVSPALKRTPSLRLLGLAVCIAALSLCKTKLSAVVCWFVSYPGRYDPSQECLLPAICSHNISHSPLQHHFSSKPENIFNQNLPLPEMPLPKQLPHLTHQ